MFRELVVSLCLAGLASASYFDHGFDFGAVTSAEVAGVSYFDNYHFAQPEGLPSDAAGVFDLRQAWHPGYAVHGRQAFVPNTNLAYNIQPAAVRTIAAPVAAPAQKVTVEAHQQVTAHPPPAPSAAPVVVNQPVQYVAVPVGYPQAPVQYAPAPQAVAHQPGVQYVLTPVAHPQVNTVAAAPVAVAPVTAAPVAAKQVTIEAHRSVTAHAPTFNYANSAPVLAYPGQYQVKSFNRPVVQYVNAPVAVTEKPIQVTTYHPQNFVTTPRTLALVRATPATPVESKQVTVESHQSVTVHPPTPARVAVYPQPVVSRQVQYVTSTVAPPQIATTQPVHSQPIPVPVQYYSAEEPQEPQVVPAVVSAQAPVAAPQPIPVPVEYPPNGAYVNYEQNASPVVYTKTIAEQNHASADLTATQVRPTGVYSPASEVSRVSFNGPGVSYGW